MRVTGGRLLRGVLAATALGWAAIGLLLALMIVLPSPKIQILMDIPTILLWLLAVLVEGYSLLLAAYTEGDPRLPPSCGVRDTSVAAVAAFYPPTDLTRYYQTQWPWWKPNLPGIGAIRDFVGGTLESIPDRYRLASPTYHVDPGDPPTFLTHGGEDQWVPPEQSELLANRLEEAGVPHRFIELPGVNHGFEAPWGSWDQQIVRHELEGFLEQRLGRQGPKTR